jgi:hypothetical protein
MKEGRKEGWKNVNLGKRRTFRQVVGVNEVMRVLSTVNTHKRLDQWMEG